MKDFRKGNTYTKRAIKCTSMNVEYIKKIKQLSTSIIDKIVVTDPNRKAKLNAIQKCTSAAIKYIVWQYNGYFGHVVVEFVDIRRAILSYGKACYKQAYKDINSVKENISNLYMFETIRER